MTTVLTLWALVAAAFSIVALVRLLRAKPVAPAGRRRMPTVLLLRPVDAPGPLELQNLNAAIDYPGELTHVVLSPFRPRLTSANTRWVASDPLCSNRKVGHLSYGLSVLERDAHTVVVTADADVRVDGSLLVSLVEGLRDGADVVSAAPHPEVGPTLATRTVRGLLVQSHHSFRVLDVMAAGPRAMCGKVLALSEDAQNELVKLQNCIGEDLELSLVMASQGRKVALASSVANVPQSAGLPMREVVARFTRWMQVLRAHWPALFPTVPVFFAPTPVLMVAAAVLGEQWLALSLCVLVGSRIALANQLDRRPGLRFEWVLAEVLMWVCWARALLGGRTVTWRGRHYTLGAQGQMRAIHGATSETLT